MSEFSEELTRLMEARHIGVRELARKVPCNPGHVSNLRQGRARPSAQLAAQLDDVLNAGGRLAALAPRSPGPTFDNAGREMHARLNTLSPAQVGDLIDHLEDQWHALVKTDNLLGPRHALGTVLDHLGVIAALLRSARPPTRRELLRLGAKYAESAAWLHEDSGAMGPSRHWTGQSMEWAVEGGDRLMVSWTLFRRSQQAAIDGDAAQVAGLALAARREGGELPDPMLAAILQQEAHAYALDGAENACHDTLDRAHTLAAAADDPGDASNGHGSFCTPAYLEMQRGACWLQLGNPAKAVTAYQTAIGSLASAYRRDRGVALGGRAAALAAIGEPEEAAKTARLALSIARDSGSGRILDMVTTVSQILKPHGRLKSVADLRADLANAASP